MLKLELTRPLAVFDIESTGINRKVDRIIDLSIIKLMPDGSRETHYFRLNPECPIPPEVTAIHGIRDDDVKDAPTFKQKAKEIAEAFGDCDLGGFNLLHFDIPILEEEFTRANVVFNTQDRFVVDAQRIFHKKEPRDLSAALKFFCGKDHTGAHSAVDDVEATIAVIKGEFERYDDLPRTMNEIDAFCNPRDPSWADRTGKLKWQDNRVVINFGKNQNKSLEALAVTDRGFLNWILKNDFPRDMQELVRHFLNGGTSVQLK